MAKTNKGERHSPLQAIKRYCKHHCCCDDRDSWKNCTATHCFLFKYRLGHGNRTSIQKQPSRALDSSKIGDLGGVE